MARAGRARASINSTRAMARAEGGNPLPVTPPSRRPARRVIPLIRETRVLARAERECRPVEVAAAHRERVNETVAQQACRGHRCIYLTSAAQHNFDILEPKRQTKAGRTMPPICDRAAVPL